MRSSAYACLSTMAVLVILVVLCPDSKAQQPAVGRKKVPVLTTDDVRPPLEEPVAESRAGETASVPGGAKTQATADAKTSPEEAAWRERIGKAREKAKTLERTADQTELKVTELRNNLGNSGQSAKYRNDTAAGLDETGQRLNDLRKDARAAAEDLAELEAYGKEHNFAEAAGPEAKTATGNANDEYYRLKYEKLMEKIQDADRRALVYENRVRDISQHILLTGGKNGGDNFYIMQLQQDQDEAQQKLNEAISARTSARNDLEALMEEARRNGVPPGVFR